MRQGKMVHTNVGITSRWSAAPCLSGTSWIFVSASGKLPSSNKRCCFARARHMGIAVKSYAVRLQLNGFVDGAFNAFQGLQRQAVNEIVIN
jgi:hypothetical protein